MEKALGIYYGWLDRLHRPPPMVEDEKPFLADIFRHFALLFTPKVSARTNIVHLARHSQLCNAALEAIASVARRHPMSPETWESLLRVLLVMTDSLLSVPESSEPCLENMLCPVLLRTLLELWLRSKIANTSMWDSLSVVLRNCRHRMEAIQQVNGISLALTLRVINLLCGSSQGTSDVLLHAGSVTTALHLPQDFFIFAWFRFIYLMGPPSSIAQAANHMAAVTGISNIVEALLQIGDNTDPRATQKPAAPYGDSILHILGNYLFDDALLERPGFENGRAQACGALCRIFCTRSGQLFTPTYLARFYRCIREGLKQPMSCRAIVHCSGQLFTLNRSGSHLLAPAFLTQFADIMTGSIGSDLAPEAVRLRRSCITILSSLVCLPNFYGELQIGDGDIARTFLSLKGDIQSLIVNALDTDPDATNQQLLLYCFCLFLFDEIVVDPSVGPALIARMVRNVIMSGAQRPPEVVLSAFEALSSLTSLAQSLHSADSKLMRWLVLELCEYIEQNVETLYTGRRVVPNLGALVESAYTTLQDLLMQCQFVLEESVVLLRVLEAVEIGITGNKGDREQLQPRKFRGSGQASVDHTLIHEAAFAMQRCLLTLAARFPGGPFGSVRISSLHVENEQWRAFAIGDDALLSVMETKMDGEPAAMFLLRDRTGRYAWRAKLRYLPIVPRVVTTIRDTLARESAQSAATAASVAAYSADSSGPLSAASAVADSIASAPPPETIHIPINGTDRTRDELDRLRTSLHAQKIADSAEPPAAGTAASSMPAPAAQTRAHRYFEMLMASQPAEDAEFTDNGSIAPMMTPEQPEVNSKAMLQTRLLMSHLGLLSIPVVVHRKQVCALDGEKLHRLLKHLDKLAERECQKTGVIYVAVGQTDQNTILQNDGGSSDFNDFVASLGWVVELATHPGFMGGLDRNSSAGKQAPYWADYRTEVIYHVPTMMPTNAREVQQIHKKRHVGNDHVHVIWSEHTHDYNPNTITSQFNFVHIVVSPMPSGLCRVRVYTKRDENHVIPIFGPLLDGMIVNRAILGTLVRQTAINANHHVRVASKLHVTPYGARQKVIEEIMTKCRKQDAPSKFYAQLFAEPLSH
eukprot:TRINITY_DN15095_c0_g1_i1.p1 TRINITY_DN15095_c0_g1~~TRINITY_DN15095_c0_g1_i1.p1  ORF type:complete len:1151 (-),score=221.33 TRINITY_DN15095_c0_g1_i1:75-3356(-)